MHPSIISRLWGAMFPGGQLRIRLVAAFLAIYICYIAKVIHEFDSHLPKDLDAENLSLLPPRDDKGDVSISVVTPSSRAPSEEITRQRSIVLLGPHERYNFGDLLFSKVLARLLEQRAGYDASRILYGGLVSINMTRFGGPSQVFSMKRIQSMSRNDALHGPYDIVYTGGEALGCNHDLGVEMMPTPELRQLAKKEKICDCAYLVPKKLLLPQKSIIESLLSIVDSFLSPPSNQNFAVVNSMGGYPPIKECRAAVSTADFIGYRDRDHLTPDSAIMTKELFSSEIEDTAKVILHELESFLQEVDQGRYIAVQHKIEGVDARILAQTLDKVSRHLKAPIVFFAAGTAPKHDSFSVYDEVSSLMEERSFVYRSEHVLEVVALISKAVAVLGTSLHVRIMAFIHFKPRITWCSEMKHQKFIQLWDASDAPNCLKVNETLPILAKYVGASPEITMDKTVGVYEDSIQQYLSFFDSWSSKLIQKQNPVDPSHKL